MRVSEEGGIYGLFAFDSETVGNYADYEGMGVQAGVERVRP